jgi:hypothetical protein
MTASDKLAIYTSTALDVSQMLPHEQSQLSLGERPPIPAAIIEHKESNTYRE